MRVSPLLVGEGRETFMMSPKSCCSTFSSVADAADYIFEEESSLGWNHTQLAQFMSPAIDVYKSSVTTCTSKRFDNEESHILRAYRLLGSLHYKQF